MNRGWDIWPRKYAKTADRAESASFWHFFGEIQYAITQRGLSDWLDSWVILNQFLELFSAVGFILWISKAAKMFLNKLDFMVKSLYAQ